MTQSWKLPSWILPIWSIGIHCVCVLCVVSVLVKTYNPNGQFNSPYCTFTNKQWKTTTNNNTVSISHGAAEEGGFLYQRFPRSRLLAGDLVEGEQKMVPLRYLRRQLYLDFLIELRLPVCVYICLCINVCLFCLFLCVSVFVLFVSLSVLFVFVC